MSIELENEFFGHFNVSDREKELLNKFKEFQQYISRTKSLPFFLCSIKDCDGLRKCVDDGFDINTEIDRESLLSIAIANNDDAIASYLFNNKFTINSNWKYLKYFLLSIKKDHKSVFDALLKEYQKVSLSKEDVKSIVVESFRDVHFISKIIEVNAHIGANGASMISDVVSHWVKPDVFEFLIGKNLIEKEKCNQFYSDTVERWYSSEQIDRLKFLSPYCDKVDIRKVESNSEKNFELIKFLLSDRKYSSHQWIVDYFRIRLFEKTDKSEILKFIVDNNLEVELLSSLMFPVFEDHYHLDLEVLLSFIDRFDSQSLNRRNKEGYTVILSILKDPYGNTGDILEKAIAKGYDANIPYIYIEHNDDDEEVITETHTLLFFFNRIELSRLNDENSMKIVRLLLNHTNLSKELIDKVRKFFSKRNNYVDGVELNFLQYLNTVFDGHSDCPQFFTENYSEEIINNQYLNLLPQTAKDIFVFP